MRTALTALVIGAGLAATTSAAWAQPVSEDMGTLAPGVPVIVNVPGAAPGVIVWYKFTLDAPIRHDSLTFLEAFTTGVGSPSGDSELALYTATGTLISVDDDDGPLNGSTLSFGAGSGTFSPSTANTPAVGNGRDGDLPAGDYYLGVAYWNGTWTSNWTQSALTTGTLGTTDLTVLIDAAPAASEPANVIDLGSLAGGGEIHRTGDTLDAAQVQWYKVELPDALNAAAAYIDMDTEGTALTPTNSTGLYVYGENGALQAYSVPVSPNANSTNLAFSDTTDGSGTLSQLTFGLTTPTRPAVGNGAVYNGRDGAVRAGIYFIGVAGPGTTPSLTGASGSNFGAVSGSGNTGTIALNIVTSASTTDPAGTYTGPTLVSLGDPFVATINVLPGANPASSGIDVTLDAALLDAGTVVLLDNGAPPDAAAGDNIYSATISMGANAATGPVALPFTVTDDQLRTSGGNANLLVVGPAPDCPTGNESFTSGNMISDGGANAATNGVATFNPSGTYEVGEVRISGRFVPQAAATFVYESRVRIISPGGIISDVAPWPVGTATNLNTPYDVVDLVVPLPGACQSGSWGTANAGEWSVRTWESFNDAGVDGTWSDLCVTLVAGTGGTGDPTIWDEDACGTDAGETLDTASQPVGSGALERINGIVTAGSDTDIYLINICDFANFSASTAGSTADTQLFLFNTDGTGVMFNDDIVAGTLQSTINNSGGQLTSNGDYYLAMSPYNRDAQDIDSALIWNNTGPGGTFAGIRSPDGPGAANPLDHWTGTATSTVPFAYGIALQGVCYPAGGTAGCNLADITGIGGTSEDPGVPDQQLTVDDIIVFINTFSDGLGCPGPNAPSGPACNRADVTGIGGPPELPDGQLTVDDIIGFFNAFSDGCLG